MKIEEDLGSALLARMVADQDVSLERELAAIGIVAEDLADSAPGLVDGRKSTDVSQADKRVVDLEDE